MKTLSLTLLAAAAAAALSACDGMPVAEPPATTPPATDAADATPTPIASLALATGQVVEFYELGGGALIMEAGEAGMPTALGAMPETRADQLLDVWKRLAPDRAVPSALVSLRDKMMRADTTGLARTPRVTATVVPELGGQQISEPTPSDLPEGTLAAPSGCNNGCCDYDWLQTFAACSNGDADYQWFLYNYGYSYANVHDAVVYRSLACAATGNSTYKISVEGGGGGTWTVTQAHYRTYYYVAPVCCNDPDISAKVNTSTTSALHTHCGYVYK